MTIDPDGEIRAIIEASKRIRSERVGRTSFLNPLSHLPGSKRRLKLEIKERIRLLYGAYIALASFVPDEEAELVSHRKGFGKRERVILKRVCKDMEKNRRELSDFDPFLGDAT